MDMNQYLEVFVDESKEHLLALNQNLLELEKAPQNLEIVNNIFRAAHTLKGMSATMGYTDLANLTHIMENVLDDIRNEKTNVSSQLLDTVFLAVDDLEAMVESIASGGDGIRDVSIAIAKLEQIEKGKITKEHAKEEIAATLEPITYPKNKYDQYEKTIIEQSKEQGYDCYELTISLRADCLLKTARVFMVFEVLEKCGDVIKTTPAVEQLEEEQFDSEFTVTIITKESREDLKKKIMKISEIESVETNLIDPVSITENSEDKIGKIEENNNNEIQASSPTSSKKQEKVEKQSNKVANKTIRVNIERLDTLMNLFEELVIDRGRLEQIAQDIENTDLTDTVERMSRISGDLQSIILNMRMVPVDNVFNRFPRMVRQLAKDLNKLLELEIIGAETELDRTVIDEIGDPIVHLLRNAIDHGIESPEVRRTNGKPETGKIQLKAYHSGNHVFIEILDDGAGINRNKVIDKAISKGIISQNEAAELTDTKAFELIMAPGFSTAETISDISGRGVGLDVVKSKIQSLGGTVSIDSVEGKGSTFSIQLPLTLSIISAMLIEIGPEKYAIPLSSIIETAIIKKSDIMIAHNQEVIDFRGKVVPLISLKDIFGLHDNHKLDEFISIVIVRKGDKMAALIVDSFIGQQEIVLKSLGNYLTEVFAISGATILGDGQVALIIDCNALIK
ncbi:chemotaxis protein CheW [Lederbergia wuyishanensis]|uniref:Chemotaxis protein CheA n=1 Tax=Lederbergia wuyishanensis TaxID=1347903 RepID=A0ABU0CZR4_9BACI|nr:chemotaxis protein CheA [Lederbergia wuyishanensis]MCJ8006285.1 chemotaxis protein CheA [Lederbergia wuyishanensis]MDQ0341654.1 two-component system chemotaxis sensor kinase CheA [Lederbergia wuyishanensis]